MECHQGGGRGRNAAAKFSSADEEVQPPSQGRELGVLSYELRRNCPFGHEAWVRITEGKEPLLSDFFKWLIVGWSIVVVGIAALGTILVVKYGEVKKIETDDVSLCFIIAFFCWLIPIIAFTILARTLGF